jgi:hypothetical protein
LIVDNGKPDRLDRIEAILQSMAEREEKLFTMGYLHEQRMNELEEETASLRRDNEKGWGEMHEREKRLDERIDKLVLAIGELVKQRQ